MNEYMRMADRMYDLGNQFEQLKKKNKELVDENETLKEQVNILKNCDKLGDTITEAYKEQLAQAKELLQNLIRVTWGEGWNYSLDWKAKAEQFLEEEA